MHAFTGSILFALASVMMTPQVRAQATADPLNGTWKLDPAASKFTSGQTVADETRVYSVTGDKVALTATGTDGAGKPISYSYTAAFDGKPYPVTGNPNGDNISLKRVDSHTIEATLRKGSAITGYGRVAVSADGQRLAFTRRMVRANAAPTVDELAYRKQP